MMEFFTCKILCSFYKYTLVNKFDNIWIGIIPYVVLNGCNESKNATNTNTQP